MPFRNRTEAEFMYSAFMEVGTADERGTLFAVA